MQQSRCFFASRWGPVVAGLVIGVVAAVLARLGNPANMGLCVVCFARDTAGALGLHRAAPVQYIRPELLGLVLGALATALVSREFRPRTGSAPLVRFVLGFFAAAGALVFLGCPWRAFLRLSGGDLNALVGLAGLAGGIVLGVLFLRRGFTLGPNRPAPYASGWVAAISAAGLLGLLLWSPQFGRDAQGQPTGPIFASPSGTPGGQHAPLLASLAAGLVIGSLAQRSRFCTVGGIRDVVLMRDPHLLNGALALMGAALGANLALGQFRLGFADQPVAHTEHLWNFAGMALAGLAFTLAGGCPGRQLVLAGEGDGDSALFFLGIVSGSACAHLFSFASGPKSTGPYGPAVVIAGLLVCVLLGLTMREPGKTGG